MIKNKLLTNFTKQLHRQSFIRKIKKIINNIDNKENKEKQKSYNKKCKF